MITQYPDTIVITIPTQATQDSNGNWVAGHKVDYTFLCRAEANSAARRIAGNDGILLDYKLLCYAPLEGVVDVLITTQDGDYITTEKGEAITVGSLITYMENSAEASYVLTKMCGSIFSGNVKNSFNGQLNSRLWL